MGIESSLVCLGLVSHALVWIKNVILGVRSSSSCFFFSDANLFSAKLEVKKESAENTASAIELAAWHTQITAYINRNIRWCSLVDLSIEEISPNLHLEGDFSWQCHFGSCQVWVLSQPFPCTWCLWSYLWLLTVAQGFLFRGSLFSD